MKFLLDHGADINHVCLAERWTPLGYAARGNRPEMVKLLLDGGADKMLPSNSAHVQPRGIAQSRGYEDVVETLDGKR